MTTSQVIRKASEILAARGWCQGAYHDGMRVCAFTALNLAAKVYSYDRSTWNYTATAQVWMSKFLKGTPLPIWNDYHTTSYEDVQLLFKNTAQLAESEGN